MKMKKLIAAGLAAAALSGTVLAGVAGADGTNPQTTGTGWDDKPDTIVGGGSDTTYAWSQMAERIYNQAGGCRVNTSGASKGRCLTTGQDQTDVTGNWDHDAAVSEYPTGSSGGINELTGSAAAGGIYDYARSSRKPNASGESGTTFWGVGKDSVAVVTFTGRQQGATLTKDDIQKIYNCTYRDWSQVQGGAFGSGTIFPIGMNSSSGTYATFQEFLGFAPNNGSCVVGLNGTQTIMPFENDVKQLNENAFLNANKANAIWWMSTAVWKSYPFKRQDAKLNNVDNRNPTNNTQVLSGQYPITRFIYHVTRTADAAPSPANDGKVVGGTSGKSGAVRQFTEFLCKPDAAHGLNEFSGDTNSVELLKSYGATGFLQVPVSQRTNGGACAVLTAP